MFRNRSFPGITNYSAPGSSYTVDSTLESQLRVNATVTSNRAEIALEALEKKTVTTPEDVKKASDLVNYQIHGLNMQGFWQRAKTAIHAELAPTVALLIQKVESVFGNLWQSGIQEITFNRVPNAVPIISDITIAVPAIAFAGLSAKAFLDSRENIGAARTYGVRLSRATTEPTTS